MKGNLKSWVFMFAVAGAIALAAACGVKGDAGPSNCPAIGSNDLNPPVTTAAASGRTITLTCTDSATTISGATTVASGCGNTYYSIDGGAWTGGTSFTGTATQTAYKYFSYDRACNAEAVKSGTF